jgi:hypothetical protein
MLPALLVLLVLLLPVTFAFAIVRLPIPAFSQVLVVLLE